MQLIKWTNIFFFVEIYALNFWSILLVKFKINSLQTIIHLLTVLMIWKRRKRKENENRWFYLILNSDNFKNLTSFFFSFYITISKFQCSTSTVMQSQLIDGQWFVVICISVGNLWTKIQKKTKHNYRLFSTRFFNF